MNILRRNRGNGITAAAIRVWGMLFVAAGMVSRCILQNTLLGLNTASPAQILALLNESSANMTLATAALVMQAAETCAVPVFALLLVEGFAHTRDWKKYLARVAAVAAVSEVPFDLAMNGALWDMSLQNPCVGLVLSIVVLYLYHKFSEPTAAHRLVKGIVLFAAIAWAEMLNIDHGTPIVVLTAVFYLMRKRTNLRGLVGAGIAMLCTVISPFYIAASMGCLLSHLYNGEQGEGNRIVNYLAYPVLLLAVFLAAKYLI